MVVDLVPQQHTLLDGLLHQLVAFEFHLPAAHVQAGEDLVVGAGAGVRHVGFVEAVLALALEVLVPDVDHAALAHGGERFVRALRGVDADAYRIRVGHARLFTLLQGGDVRLVFFAVGIAVVLAVQARSAEHGGALLEDVAEASECEPGLIPEEDHVRLDGEHLLHHALHVVHHTVEGAVGEQEHLHMLEASGAFQLQQFLADGLKRYSAVHAEFRQRVAVQVHGISTGKHEAIVVALVTVAVDQHHVVRLHQGLKHDLITGACAVGGEVGELRAEGARGTFLRLLQRAGGL